MAIWTIHSSLDIQKKPQLTASKKLRLNGYSFVSKFLLNPSP